MKNRKPLEKPLKHFLNYGIKVIATYQTGETLGSWKDPKNFTVNLDEIRTYWKQGIRRFQFHPYTNGFLCFDIDRKNGKDGLIELYRIFTMSRLAMPSYLLDIETFPALTVTPSGGLHLYFRYTDTTKYRPVDIAQGLEVFHYNHLLTVPGSRKGNREYRFYGDLREAPELPPVIKRFLTEYENSEKISRPVWTYNQKQHGKLSIEDIAGVIDRQGRHSPEASRNRYSYEIAWFARKQGYPPGEIEAYLLGRFEAPDFPGTEIKKTIQSAFKR